MEKTFNIELTEKEVNVIKNALWYSGIEFTNNREIFKKLCNFVCDEDDKKILSQYE